MIPESAPHLYQSFWTEFIAYCKSTKSTLHLPQSAPRRKYLPFAIGRTGFSVVADIDRGSAQVECTLWILKAKAPTFSELSFRETIVWKLHEKLGRVLFAESPGGRAFKVFEFRPCDLSGHQERAAAHKWLKEHCESYVSVFTPIVKDL